MKRYKWLGSTALMSTLLLGALNSNAMEPKSDIVDKVILPQ